MKDMTEKEARAAVDAVRDAFDNLAARVLELHERNAWVALKYPTWEAMCQAEFGTRKLPPVERKALTTAGTAAGMSVRAIAAAAGADLSTISRDRKAGVANATPASAPPPPTRGLDGKTYPAPQPAPPAQPAKPKGLGLPPEEMAKLRAQDRAQLAQEDADYRCEESLYTFTNRLTVHLDVGLDLARSIGPEAASRRVAKNMATILAQVQEMAALANGVPTGKAEP
jgi:hypothetical protein